MIVTATPVGENGDNIDEELFYITSVLYDVNKAVYPALPSVPRMCSKRLANRDHDQRKSGLLSKSDG